MLLFLSTFILPEVIGQIIPDTLWTRTFGGSYNERAFSVHQTSDYGFIVAGEADSNGNGQNDFWLVKVDEYGNEIWNQTYGGYFSESAKSVQQTSDGGYILAGINESYEFDESAIWIVKTDSIGNEIWNQSYGASSYATANCIQQTTDDGYIIAGSKYQFTYRDFWVIKTDENGDEIWNQTYTYGIETHDFASSIQQTIDGGYIIVGSTVSYPSASEWDVWLLKIDESGNEIWNQTYGGSSTDIGRSVIQSCDSGFILAGETYSFGAGNNDFWVVKTDVNGNEIWNQTYGSNLRERAYAIKQTNDNGYILSGYTQIPGSYFEFWIVKINENGDEIWNQAYGGDDEDRAYSVIQTSDYGYLVAGSTNSYGSGQHDFWLVRLDSENTIVDNQIFNYELDLNNYPNPFNPSTTIEFSIQNDTKINLSIFNIKGQKIKTLVQNEFAKGNHSIIWNGEDEFGKSVSSGIYYYKLIENDKIKAMKKCLLLK